MTQRYRLEGLDCAVCASKVEGALQKTAGLEMATVNFSTGIARFDPDLEEKARKVIREVEPGVTLLRDSVFNKSPKGPSDEDGSTVRLGRFGGLHIDSAVVRIVGAGLLFLVGVVFSRSLSAIAGGWAVYAVLIPAYLLVGWRVLLGAVRNILKGEVFDELFLMSIASIGAMVIGELHEAVGVMLFYSVGDALQDRAVERSRSSIREALALRPDLARVVEGSVTRDVDPETVEPGTIIEVRPGEAIPLDGVVVQGSSFVDTSALTGESVPRRVEPEDEVSSGFVNDEGRLLIQTTRPFGESSAARILDLVENAAAKKAPTEKFITSFARIYTPVVVGSAAALAFLPPLLWGLSLSDWVYRALVFLVVSCPCALVISIPLGYFGGIGAASRRKILVKGADVIDALKEARQVVFDKTGTLTDGEFRLRAIRPAGDFTEWDLLELAAHAESLSNHPIARSIRDAYGGHVEEDRVGDFREEKGFGIIADMAERRILVGSSRLLTREGIDHPPVDDIGSVVHVAIDGTYAGSLHISDGIKPGAAEAAADLRGLGVEKLMMLTGDEEQRAREVTEKIGLDGYRSGLLPEQKVTELESIMAGSTGKTLFVGDGINDAPVIMRADIGIAMGGVGSDAAIEAADVVLMDDDPRRVPQALSVARRTRRIVTQNILFALIAKAGFLLLGAFGLLSMGLAVVGDVGVALLAVLNATRLLRTTDNTH